MSVLDEYTCNSVDMIHECTQVSPTVASCDWLRRAMLKLVMLEF
jgi:hypothetical protein